MTRPRRAWTVYRGWSALSGRIRVVDDARERRLIVRGAILSAYPLDGDWSAIEREYWWKGVQAVRFPRRPRVLLVGLGGGTQVHLVHRLTMPRLVTAIERDPAIVSVAQRWFGLGDLGPLEFLCGEAEAAAAALARAGRRFDFVMEDAAYSDGDGRSQPLVMALVPLVARGGTLVVNRHRRGDAREIAALLRPRFGEVRMRRVRREGENVLVFAARPRRNSRRSGSGGGQLLVPQAMRPVRLGP